MKSISEILIKNKNQDYTMFCAPGHKHDYEKFAKAGYGEFFRNMLNEDVASFPESDGKAETQTPIRVVMDNYADLYGVIHTELLAGGTEAGLIATILASVPGGGQLILGRNSQMHAYSAIKFGRIQPAYMRADYMEDYGLQTGISAEEVRAACENNPDAYAVLITSPNYYGMVSNIEEIAEIVHSFNMILIVDQSHGAHLKFFDAVTKMNFSAEECGADIVINNTSENLLSMTGTGIVNVCSNRVDINKLRECIKMLQSEVPSYLLYGSLDINEQIMRRWGGDMVVAWLKDLQYAYSRLSAISGVTVLEDDSLDVTKITIGLAELGVSGEHLFQDLLREKIMPATVHGDYVTLVTGAGNKRDDYMQLVAAIRKIANNYAVGRHEIKEAPSNPDFVLGVTEVPTESERIPLYRADGRVIYDPIITYPPGTPIACPGEIMNMEVIAYIARTLESGKTVSGVDEEGQIYVGLE